MHRQKVCASAAGAVGAETDSDSGQRGQVQVQEPGTGRLLGQDSPLFEYTRVASET